MLPYWFCGQSDVCAPLDVLMQNLPKIHSVKLVATQDEVVIVRPLEEVAHVLPHGVGSSLIPLRAGGRLLRGENVYKAARKIIELVAGLDVPMQRHAVELSQDIDRPQLGVQTIADGDVDDAIFAAERHRRFGAILLEGKQAL